jgi:hypothetical protein
VPKTKKVAVGKTEKVEPVNTKSMKAYVCKSVEKGIICPYGKRCNFAHSASELETKKCIYGDDCNRIKIKKGTVANMDEKNPCIFMHPSEAISTFLDRRKIIGLPLEDVKDPCVYRCTRMCVSYTDGIKCLKGDECTYAHTVDELRATKCNFGENCHNVSKNSDLYLNKGEKVCVFLHPDETLDNFYNRALKKKNDKLLEKIEVIVESDDEETQIPAVCTHESVDENTEINFEEIENTSDSTEEHLETLENESVYLDYTEYENEKIEEYEEACIVISLPRNQIGKLCELILSSDVKARITKQ